MKRIRRVLFAATLVLALVAYWSYRNTIALVEASNFQPVAPTLPPIPTGTKIRAVLSNGINEATKPGDNIIAFILVPVLVNGHPVLPGGIRLKGMVDQIEQETRGVTVQIQFDELLLDRKISLMETKPVVAITRVTSDIEILTHALNTITGAGVGIAIGVGSLDPNVIVSGLALGTQFGVPGPTNKSTQFTLVLTQPLHVQT